MPNFPSQPDGWQLRTRRLRFGRLPLLMGIVNVTPDSFSDGGRFFSVDAAVEHGMRLAAGGAGMLDVGGESTRPGAAPVTAEEELRRVLPVIRGLVSAGAPPISIDTSKALVAREALAAGAEAINDVTALEGDPAMLPLAAESGCGVCAMHMRGDPQTMQAAPHYDDVVAEVLDFLRRRRDALVAAGVRPEAITLDPGIGFGKTTAHNLALLRAAANFTALGCPILVGPSRKRFIGEVLCDPHAERLSGTIGAALAVARGGAQILRVHDVAEVGRALQLFAEADGLDG